ncbi:MAG: hypothetical protein RL120_12190 [Gammaproteobacteria bacterium]
MNKLLRGSLLLLAGLLAASIEALSLDESASADPLLGVLAAALDAGGIDVAGNLNDRELARGRIDRPRLGSFPDLPLNSLPFAEEINAWEAAFSAGDIAGIAILAGDTAGSLDWQGWLQAPATQRVFITLDISNLETAAIIAKVASEYGYGAMIVAPGQEPGRAGRLYTTAGRRLAIDSSSARRYRGDVTELSFLGERQRQDQDSIFRDAANRDDRSLSSNEPEVFRKETLGDEFTRSTIREIVVPGGIALGETARLELDAATLRFDGELHIEDAAGKIWDLPAIEAATARALFDFARRSERIESDAVVDIDERGRVRISSALRDTDAGYALLHADTRPFAYVNNLRVSKSVMIDTAVQWYADRAALTFDSEFEVRFLSANSMRIAVTRAALQYSYSDRSGLILHEQNWGPEANRLSEKLDYAGLGNEVSEVARLGAWVALFRALDAAAVPFLQGRYEFMKIDKQGRQTPARY